MADDYYGDTTGVEVLLDDRPLQMEKWRRYAVHREDIIKAQSGQEIRYGCDGDVVVRPAFGHDIDEALVQSVLTEAKTSLSGSTATRGVPPSDSAVKSLPPTNESKTP